jgi:ribosomal peptide maturation radical SAM protein 1
VSNTQRDLRHLADPVRLELLNATFRLELDELARRGRSANGGAHPVAPAKPHGEPRSDVRAADLAEAARLTSSLRRHMSDLSDAALADLHRRLAGQLLLEIDRRMATPGSPPGERADVTALLGEARTPRRGGEAPRVGLVSLPWMSPALPSIQLATLASALRRQGVASEVHELYVDFAARIGLNLYNYLGNLLGFLPEWVFSRHYYAAESGDDLRSMLEQQPLAELPWPELADSLLEALDPVTRSYLDDMLAEVEWGRYAVLGFSLTISQLGASMAFARLVKLEYPSTNIVFGGSQCAGEMGRAILRICPYVDVVVQVEGELAFPELVAVLSRGETCADVAGISYRTEDGGIETNPGGELYQPDEDKLSLDYDPYFRRLARLNMLEKVNPWIPFESSRGCWYGEKVQCTFCGLHEIMRFRRWSAEAVLEELERLRDRYGIGRFYCMDLIMPRDYLRTLLPEIARRGHEWMFFYEIKANMKRHELETLAAAGVRWVQPGIESLDEDLLRLMRKGVSPLQNVLLLKWSRELDVFCGWNLLYGLPGETEASYRSMTALIPKLTHLQPPSGGGEFQLHRFSPYFEQPEHYGIRWTGAHPMFRHAFPVPAEDLDDLVYLHSFERDPDRAPPVDTASVEAAVSTWRSAFRRGARFDFKQRADGSAYLVDRRDVRAPARTYELGRAEAALYVHLDGGVAQSHLADSFEAFAPAACSELGGESGVRRVLDHWLEHDLVVDLDRRVVALAVNKTHPGAGEERGPGGALAAAVVAV